jgi:hypothetical protein
MMRKNKNSKLVIPPTAGLYHASREAQPSCSEAERKNELVEEEDMGKVKLFWKTECPQCGNAKIVGGQLKEEGMEVLDYNLDTMDGLAEASFYGVMSTPTIIVEDEQENTIALFSGKVPSCAEVKRTISAYFN